MRAKLSPLLPLPPFKVVKSGKSTATPTFVADVAALQAYLNSRGACIEVDGKTGPKTREALEHYGAPPEREIPPLCAWGGRSWASNPKRVADKAASLGLDRVSLFLTPLEAKGHFSAFTNEAGITRAIDACKAVGVGVDLTAWIWPRKSYLRGMQAAISDLLDEYRDVRLCLDAEGPWSQSASKSERAEVVEDLYTWLPPERIAVTDYASIQETTRSLVRPWCVLQPQVYSVAYTQSGPTKPASVYWPGRTQGYGMNPRRWGGLAGECQLEIGLASYKAFDCAQFAQAEGGPWSSAEEWQIVTQIRSALWFAPTRLVFWELERMTDTHEAVVRRLASGSAASDGG